MKKTIVVSTLVILIGLITSCESDREPVGPPGPNPGVVSIPLGETRAIQPYGLEITFDTLLEDSRCPIGAYCFWGGMAKIKLYVASSDTDRQALIFHIDPAQPAPDTSRFVVTDAGRFRINLLSLEPYPNMLTDPLPGTQTTIALTVTPYQAAEEVIGAAVPSRLPESTLLGEAYHIDSVWIHGTKLNMIVIYSGGCNIHNYTLFMDPIVFAESDPVQANLHLHHYGDGDACLALITEHLKFDLGPVIALHVQYYGYEADILLNVYGQPNSTWVLKETVVYEPPEYVSPIMPMATGNYWIYADTIWFDGVPTASLDTFTVVDDVSDSLGDWWVLSGRMLTLGNRIMIKGDSIYTLQHGWMVDYAEREYIPPVDTPVTYYMILEGDLLYERTVFDSDTSITTPAGTFGNLWRYDYIQFCSVPFRQFFRRGVGFVYQEQPLCFFDYGNTTEYARRTWLVEYHLQ